MKNHVCFLGLLFVGICITDAFKLPGIPDLTNGTAESVIDKIQSLSKDAADKAKADLNNALNNLQSYANKISQQVEKASSAAEKELNNEFNDLSSDIRKCLEHIGHHETKWLRYEQERIQECVQNNIKKAESIVRSSIQDIQNTQSSFDSVKERLSHCNSNVSMSLTSFPKYNASSSSCILSALKSIPSDTLLLPANMAKHVLDDIALVQGLQKYALLCANDLKGDIAFGFAERSRAITECYASVHQYQPLLPPTSNI